MKAFRQLICHLYVNPCLIFLLTLFSVHLTNASTIIVTPADSIQTAINNAVDGDTIQLTAGTFIQEAIVISKSLNFVGAGESTIFQAPPSTTHLTNNFSFGGTLFWCILTIDNQAAPTPQTVNISNIKFDGSDQQDTTINPIYGSSNRFFAIGYHNANGMIQNVHTTNTRQLVNFNELAGGGIVNASDQGTVLFNITNTLVDFYQRLGIDCRGAALTANISNCTINRAYFLPPNTTTATPNGIQFSVSATGSVTDSIISENISTVPDVQAVGILPINAGANILLSGNTVNDCDIGIAAISCGNNLEINNNTVNFTIPPTVNTVVGIFVSDTVGLSTLNNNVMNNIPDINMDLVSLTNQSFNLMNNLFNGSQTGLLVEGGGTVGPIVTMNGDSFVGTIGFYIQENAAPNDIWPSTASVSFDGLVSGHMTLAEFNQVLTKIFDKHNDPALGLVLDFIVPVPPNVTGINPTSGPTTGGTLVTITGSNFLSSNTQVFFGGIPGIHMRVVNNTTIIATAPPGTGIVDVTVQTPFGTSPNTPADQFTYIEPPPQPPIDFVGVIKTRCKFNPEYTLKAKWKPSPSLDVILYRIYKGNKLIAEIPSSDPLRFIKTSHSKDAFKKYVIVAVNSNHVESEPLKIKILND